MPAHTTTRCSIRHSLFLVQGGNKHEQLETVVTANLQRPPANANPSSKKPSRKLINKNTMTI
jgi:hypothetical protein